MSSGPAAERCEICGQSNPSTLEEHHVVPRRFGGSDHPENLAKLCGGCHNAIERIYDDSFYERLQMAPVREVRFEDVKTAGAEADPWESSSRQFPNSPKHIEMVPMPPHRQWKLDVLDEEVVQFVTAANRIEQLEDELEDLQEELEAEAEFDPELETVAEQELAVETELGFARQRSAMQEAAQVVNPISTEEEIELVEQTIGNVKEDFDDEDTIAIESDYSQVISCGYCNMVFAEYEPEAAARHLQLAHHIDDPYDAVGMSDDEIERIKTRLGIEQHFENFPPFASSDPGGAI